MTTASASAVTNARARPTKPRLSLRANRSSIRRTTPSPTPSNVRPATPDQNSAPQGKPRRTGSAASIGTGSIDGSDSGVIWIVPRPSLAVSSASVTTTPGSSNRNVAGRRGWDRSFMTACLRSGTARHGRGGYEAASARCLRARSLGGRKRRKRKSLFSAAAVDSPRKAAAPLNSASGSAGRSPGKVATSVLPSKNSPPVLSPAAGVPSSEGNLSRPCATCASRVARTAASATTSISAPVSSALTTARETARRSTASSRSWLE